ncbi:MAG: 30S ribosomal protein S6 [Chloroflexi bacterium]|jgi:small subunit ribosomal protein S6|nr:30S ribosomal protein S6 [Anaerolineaceae bacterium]NMB87871.1 30S ribosomal protein S6 [Chloroflexota bacterium]
MRDYEIVCIIQADLDETTTNGVIEKVGGWISDSGGAITKIDRWGKRRMAYAIRKQRDGYYVLYQAQIQPSFLAEFERNLKLQEPVLRHLVIAVE